MVEGVFREHFDPNERVGSVKRRERLGPICPDRNSASSNHLHPGRPRDGADAQDRNERRRRCQATVTVDRYGHRR